MCSGIQVVSSFHLGCGWTWSSPDLWTFFANNISLRGLLDVQYKSSSGSPGMKIVQHCHPISVASHLIRLWNIKFCYWQSILQRQHPALDLYFDIACLIFLALSMELNLIQSCHVFSFPIRMITTFLDLLWGIKGFYWLNEKAVMYGLVRC